MKCLYVFLLALGVSQFHVAYLRSKIFIKIKDKSPVQINKREGAEICLVISNTSFLQSPYIHIFLKPTYHIESKQYKSVCVTIPPFSQKEVKIEFEAKYSGKEFIEIEQVILQDFFEIAKRKLYSDERREVAVLPQVDQMDYLQYLLNSLESKTTKEDRAPIVAEEGEVSYDLRPYREGDSLRLLHWKLVARRDVYMVRQREKRSTITDEYVIVVDPLAQEQDGNKRVKLVDKTLVAAVSCISALLKLEKKVTLVYFKEGYWEDVSLTGITNIQEVAKALSMAIVMTSVGNNTSAASKNSVALGERTKSRWPGEYLKQIGKLEMSKLFISAKIDASLLDEIEEEKAINLLAMSRGAALEEYFGDAWYLSDELEVVRNV